MQEVAEGVFRLGSRGHNFYLVRSGREAILIDAGCSKEWATITEALNRLGLPVSALEAMLVTHVHADHFGSAPRASSEGVDVVVGEADVPRARGTYEGKASAGATDLPIYRLTVWRNFWPMIRAGVMTSRYLDVVGTVRDGDILDMPGHPVAVHTPGHTEGHTMFHMADLGILFTGDGLVTMDLLGPGKGPQIIDDRFSADGSQVRESVDRIVGLDADLILPGHGDPWAGSPADAVRIALAA